MEEDRTSAGRNALLLALISTAAVALFAGLFSGLEVFPFGDDDNLVVNESRTRAPPPIPPTIIALTAAALTAAIPTTATPMSATPMSATPMSATPTTAGPASGPGEPGFRVDETSVEVRSGPSPEYPVIGVINRGQTFTPNGRTPAGDWLQFPWEGRDGWVYAPSLTVTGSGQLPEVRDFTPLPPDSPPPGSSPPDSPPSGPPPPGADPPGTVPLPSDPTPSGPPGTPSS